MAQRTEGGDELEAVVVDPVCGVPLLAGDDTTLTLRHRGRTWRFCSQECRGHFVREAERALLAEALQAGRLLTLRARARWGAA